VERLLEKRSSFDPAEEYLADLIRASEPVVVSPARQQRLLNRVMLRRHSRGATTSRLLRPVFALGVLSLAGATAAATIGRRAWVERNAVSAAPAGDRIVAIASPSRQPRRARPMSTGQAPEAPPAVAEAPPAPDRAPAHSPRHAAKVAGRVRTPASEDPSRVVDAIHALRNDHDPVRAGKLLAEYLSRYPRGALSEEAVALSIEAAAARHSAAAAMFAQRYLRQYPNGRFRRAAEQALKQQQPEQRQPEQPAR
jgi:hypothetical protein